MPSHPDRVRRNYPEMHCEHLYVAVNSSDVAPYIESNGDRTTIKKCINCNNIVRITRSQETFIKELQTQFPFLNA